LDISKARVKNYSLFDDLGARNHRLDTFQGLATNQQRNCVRSFMGRYSDSSTWVFHRDPKLHTTMYLFEFDGSVWKTRISFLYPFVNYMTQVIGVNKRTIGSVSVILPTATVGTKVRRLSTAFNEIQKILETHNSDNLWNYIFIFLKNVSTHYGQIKDYVGSRTRASQEKDYRQGTASQFSRAKSINRKSRSRRQESIISTAKCSTDTIQSNNLKSRRSIQESRISSTRSSTDSIIYSKRKASRSNSVRSDSLRKSVRIIEL